MELGAWPNTYYQTVKHIFATNRLPAACGLDSDEVSLPGGMRLIVMSGVNIPRVPSILLAVLAPVSVILLAVLASVTVSLVLLKLRNF